MEAIGDHFVIATCTLQAARPGLVGSCVQR
jgi:hypothetical protein